VSDLARPAGGAPARSPRLSYSIALETANLDIAGIDDLRACIASLERQTPSAAQASEVVLVNDGRVDDAVVDDLVRRYPWLQVRHDPTAGYVAMKLDAAATMTADIVLLCDSDVVYGDGWLAAMLEPFADPEVDVVAGETSTPNAAPTPSLLR
jgi:glycosyltransferase involved in cell wall biosynthesis